MRGRGKRRPEARTRGSVQWVRERVRVHLGQAGVVRLAGGTVATAGIVLMGFGTIGSPLSLGALAKGGGGGNQSISSISAVCSGAPAFKTSGTLTVSGAVNGDAVTLEVFAHLPGGAWTATGGTHIITLTSGTSDYGYAISGVPAKYHDGTVSGDAGNDAADPDAAGDDYNAWRVQVESVVGSFTGTTTKSGSYECDGTKTSSSSTSTSSNCDEGSDCSTTSSTSSSCDERSDCSTTSSTSSSCDEGSDCSTTSSTSSTHSTTSKTHHSSSSSSSSSSSATAPGTSSATTSSVSSGTAPAGTTTTISTGVGAATTTTPSTGADVEFGAGLGLLVAGGGLVAAASRLGRRPKR